MSGGRFVAAADGAAGARADLDVCRSLLRTGSRSFSAAARLLPRRVRDPATAVYAFCRLADDAVDGAVRPAAGLDQVRRRLDRVYGGRPGEHPVERAFGWVVSAYALPRGLLDWLVEGFTWDAEGRAYPDLASVRSYAVRVAGTVGAMMCLLMGRRDGPALARAIDLGVAMQLTNIARDVGEDARRGRLYLPLDHLAEAGVEPEVLLAGLAFSPALGTVVARVLREAERLYARADRGIPLLPWDCRPAIRAARLIYADIGRELARAGGDSVSRRAVVGSGRKAWLLLRAMGGVLGRDGGAELPPLAEAVELIEVVRA